MRTIHINIEDNEYNELMKIGINIQNSIKEYIKNLISNDIEVIYPNDKDYYKLEKYREERKNNPENYLSEDSIKADNRGDIY